MNTATLAQAARLVSPTPRLRVRDIVQASEFYRSELGFTITHYEGRPPREAILVRDDLRLILELAGDGAPAPMSLDIAVQRYDVWLAELQGRGVDVTTGEDPNGRWCEVRDSDGHVIRFVELG